MGFTGVSVRHTGLKIQLQVTCVRKEPSHATAGGLRDKDLVRTSGVSKQALTAKENGKYVLVENNWQRQKGTRTVP